MRFFTLGSLGALIFGFVAAIAAPAAVASGAGLPSASSARAYVALPRSVPSSADVATGHFVSPRMSVEVVLRPRNEEGLAALLQATYDPHNARYHDWLRRTEFDALFAPESSRIDGVARFLRSGGLTLQPTSSPFLVRASGPSSAIESLFQTHIETYRDASGESYFANARPVLMPASLAPDVFGVVGLIDTIRMRSQAMFATPVARERRGVSPNAGCQYPYPTRQQLYLRFGHNVPYLWGYGGGPSCLGLTLPQLNALYGAPGGGAAVQGRGVNIAVFELSAYTESDITTWFQYYFGQGAIPPLTDELVDGGPLSQTCPGGDTCFPGYNGDDEVDLDIETALAMAPAANMIYVYNAPNDTTGQTTLDELTQIANDDVADVVSSSWLSFEIYNSAAYEEAENTIFEQMAMQGQSYLNAAGDGGGLPTSNGTFSAGGESAQPWSTGVGGTSFESFNPKSNEHPAYPKTGTETVWNVDGLCNTGPLEGPYTGPEWCGFAGAGGGSPSYWWGMQPWQTGPGVISSYTTYGNGTNQCIFAATGTPCRETPDISAVADYNTGYALYCTGTDGSSTCLRWTTYSPSPGWYEIGGTSASTPLWAGIIADRNGYIGARTGDVAEFVYPLFNAHASKYFHDITGVGQTINNNGYFPVTPGYDMATGIGTPKMMPLITETP